MRIWSSSIRTFRVGSESSTLPTLPRTRSLARRGEVLLRDGPAAAVTQVIPIKNADMTKLSQTLRPFLTTTGNASNFIVLPENRLIIVTDYAVNVKSLVEILKLIDQPTGQAVIDFYLTRNRTPASLIEQVEALIEQNGAASAANTSSVKLFNDASGKRVIVAGEKERVQRILDLLGQLDTGMEFQTRVYRLENIAADRINKLIRGLVSSEEADTAIESTIDQEGNLLVVRAADEVHQQIETLVRELDRPVDSDESPIQFYKLKNANAVEVLFSLLALQQAAGIGLDQQTGGLGFGQFGTLGGLNVGGVNQGIGFGAGGLLPSGGFGNSGFGAVRGDTGGQAVRMPFENGNADNVQGSARQNQNQALSPLIGGGNTGLGGGFGGIGAGISGAGQVVTLPGGARVSADVATNSLIVFAPTSVQPLYEKLIRSLDQRRPQVMIEAEIVAVDTSDNFSLGVEVSAGDRTGASRLFKFTSFGLSEVNSTTGALTVSPNLGFNGVLVDPDVADVIVQALSRHTEPLLPIKSIHFVDHPINVVAKVGAAVDHIGIGCEQFRDRGVGPKQRIGLKSPIC